MKIFITLLLSLLVVTTAWSMGEDEASSRRGKYLADIGTIIPPDEIFEDVYIAALDFQYPQPEGEFGANLYVGHRQISNMGQEEVFVIGMQGRRVAFEELPRLNIALVIDTGASMSAPSKFEWVMESLQILIETIRDNDSVAVVAVGEEIETIIRSANAGGSENRSKIMDAIRALNLEGDAGLHAGLQRGFEEVLAHYDPGYINRVLFLSDGIGDSKGSDELAESYKDRGIYISAIGYGEDFNLELMRTLAKRGGGSSRFISDKAVMKEVFGDGLGRMIAPASRDISLEFELFQDIRPVETWGYNHEIDGQIIRYFLPAIHYGDYETIVIHAQIPERNISGRYTIASLEVEYTNPFGDRENLDPIVLSAEYVSAEDPVEGFTDATVLKAGTMLHYAQALKKIGAAYYKAQEIKESRDIYEESIHGFIGMSNGIKKELANARRRLDYVGFEDEINVLEKYLAILGYELNYEDPKITLLMRDEDIEPSDRDRGLLENLNNLFHEMELDMKNRKPGRIAVSGFTFNDGREADLVDLLNNTGQNFLLNLPEYEIVDMDTFFAVLNELELSLTDLNQTTLAVEVGKLLSVDYILTGSIVELSTSVAIFGRIINVQSAAVESAGQIIVPRDAGIDALLEGEDPRKDSGKQEPAHVEIVEVQINDIFPVFYKYYDDNPAGRIIVRNNEELSLADFRVSFYVEEYMTNPKLCKVLPRIGPNEEIEFDIFSLLKSDVLDIIEPTKVSSEIILKFSKSNNAYSTNTTQTIRIYDRNSITWEDDRRAAAFVTAKDPSVLELSKQVTGAVKDLAPRVIDENLAKAIALFEALYLFGINYEIDPNSSYIELHDQEGALDFLQFPRQTLRYGAGDCDDLSILYSALLKSVGVEGAFITIPGHIYMAFSLSMKPDEATRFFTNSADLIVENQKAWIPVEITAIDGGFLEAWRQGAQQWRDNAETAMFYEIEAAQRIYEPVGLPGQSGDIEVPPVSSLRDAFSQQLGIFINREIHAKSEPLLSKIEENPDDARTKNRLGLLYARYGLYEKAESVFQDILSIADFVPAMLNLGNIFYLKGEMELALEQYTKVYGENPERVGVLLPMARAYYILEDYDSAAEIYAILEEEVPEHAATHAYLGDSALGQARASRARTSSEAVDWAEE